MAFLNNIIVTGIPRSGTSLTTKLVDSLFNSVCINEPSWHWNLMKQSVAPDEFVQRLIQDYSETRKKIINKKPILDLRDSHNNQITNFYKKENKRKRKNFVLKKVYPSIEDRDFLLGMKHNAPYTSVLPNIIKTTNFSVICLLRNPVSTIMSWRSLKIPISFGKLPAGELFWPELATITGSNEKTLKKQVLIYDLFCKRYLQCMNQVHIIKYENLVKNPFLLESLTKRTFTVSLASLTNENQNSSYNLNEASEIMDLLTKFAPHAMEFYPLS